jgi:predicted nucleic acid-binding protein
MTNENSSQYGDIIFIFAQGPNPPGTVADHIAAVGEETVCTSIVVAAELRFGAVKSESKKLAGGLGRSNTLPFDPRLDRTRTLPVFARERISHMWLISPHAQILESRRLLPLN